MRRSGLNLTHGVALGLVCVSAVAGLATLLLCWWYRFGLARVTAALAVAAVVVGWAAGQAPRLLPGLTVVQAAAGRSTLVALIVAVGCGAVVLVPSLGLLYTLFLRGRLDTQEHGAAARVVDRRRSAGVVAGGSGEAGRALSSGARMRAWGSTAVAGLVAGTGLLVFADANWEHLVGLACLVVCAVAVFLLAAPGDA